MRPITLSHQKPISDIKYNSTGDIIFTCTKEKGGPVTAWWSSNGERIGTYDGHNGAIYNIDINRASTRLLTGAADNTAKLWDVETGRELKTFKHETTVRCVSFAVGDKKFFTITENIMGLPAAINIYKLADDIKEQSDKSTTQIRIPNSHVPGSPKITQGLWGWHNETIITAWSDGFIRVYSVETCRESKSAKVHEKEIGSLSYDKYRGTILTASKDGSAKLLDANTLQVMKTYETGRPLNASAFSPLMDHVIVGGGEDARDSAVSATKSDQYKVRFYHSILCEELGSILGHFGPVHVLRFSPDGKSFASGGEDSFVRLHYFDDSYFERRSEISQY